MSHELRRRIFDQLDSLTLIDPHTHINPLAPASETLADILGYHYYTELAHSAGMPKAEIEADGSPKERVEQLFRGLGPIDNTIQWSWFVEMCRAFFGFEGDEIGPHNWEPIYDEAARRMQSPDWANQVLQKSKLSAVFLTNDFDDPLEGFDTNTYIPCLRTDDLVFHLAKPEVRSRLERFTGINPSEPSSLRQALGALFDHFVAKGARACAISLPPDFAPQRVLDGRAQSALDAIVTAGTDCGDSHRKAIANFVFWTLAGFCRDYGLPFDLMIGVNRSVYPAGVHQGRDLYDSRVSLHQYKELFNAFPSVKFPVSVLASVTNQELASYAWIFPNVVCNGHWWYSNTPTFIEHDLAARLEAVPRTKQIAYYSDMYKLEFALPKFAMYKRCLAKVLAERYVIDRGWSEERAVAFGTQVLRDNTEQIFPAVDREAVSARNSLNSFASDSSFAEAPAFGGPDATSLAGMAAASLGAAAAYGATNLSGVPSSPFEESLNPLQPSAYSSRIEPPADMGEELDLAGDELASPEASASNLGDTWPGLSDPAITEPTLEAPAEPATLAGDFFSEEISAESNPPAEPLSWKESPAETAAAPDSGSFTAWQDTPVASAPAEPSFAESMLEPLELGSEVVEGSEIQELDLAPELEIVSDEPFGQSSETNLTEPFPLNIPEPPPEMDEFKFDFDDPTPPEAK